jgi:glyoxylase-like metal-dependent hydrolase (beta-lactamase superfamily II)
MLDSRISALGRPFERGDPAVPPDEVDMVVLTPLHRDHVGWNLMPQGERYGPTFPNARYWMSTQDWDVCHQPEVQPQRFPNSPT